MLVKPERVKRCARRTNLNLRKQLAKEVKVVGELPPLSHNKIEGDQSADAAGQNKETSNDSENQESTAARTVVYTRKQKEKTATGVEKTHQIEDNSKKDSGAPLYTICFVAPSNFFVRILTSYVHIYVATCQDHTSSCGRVYQHPSNVIRC